MHRVIVGPGSAIEWARLARGCSAVSSALPGTRERLRGGRALGLEQNRQKDLMQFDIPVEKVDLSIEYFTISCEKVNDRTTDLLFLWDDVKTKLMISF